MNDSVERRIPYDLDAEEAMLGAMMLSRDALDIGSATLTSADFYKPAHAAAFDALIERYNTGEKCDPVSVAAHLAERGGIVTEPSDGWRHALMSIMAATPASANADAYAQIVVDRSERRRLMAETSLLHERTFDLTTPISETLDALRVAADNTGRMSTARRHLNYREWSQTVNMDEAWVMPGVMELGERLIIVGGEGSGKSLWERQMAVQLACGLHWFGPGRVPPRRTMVVDVENSERQIVRQTDAKLIAVADRKAPGWNDDNFVVLPYPKLDLNARADRLDVESYLSGHRPDLLVIGPLYKIFQSDARHNYEEQALRAQRVLDDWRHRYGCAIIIEHHAPKAREGGMLDPRGSAAWLGWPEFGISMERPPDVPSEMRLRHFRGQREERDWPPSLHRSSPWPFMPPPNWQPQVAGRVPHVQGAFDPEEAF